MKFNIVFVLALLIGMYSCNTAEEKVEVISETTPVVVDTTTKVVKIQLKTDYPERVYKFKKMADATIEEQVVKYETFAVLFIEYVEIYKNHPLYSLEDQENNTESYNVLRDEMVSLKEKLRKNMTVISKAQEVRLDEADARMNKFLPQVFK